MYIDLNKMLYKRKQN